MTENTQNPKKVTDEEQDDVRFKELNTKEDRTEEENKELGELKERYGKRMQKKIDKMKWETETEREARERAEKELQETKARLAALESKPAPEPLVDKVNDTIEIGGKKYYTDEALLAQIKSGKITDQDAFQYQRKRDKEEVKLELKQELGKETKKESENETRVKDAESVLKEYPEFSKTHPSHNPEDQLYKTTTEIYKEGYASNPKGLSLALKRAKQILRITDKNIDRTDDLNLDSSGAPPRTPKEKELTLSEDEKTAAERMYIRAVNPKTGRNYTANEAYVKALEAKKSRRT